MSDDEVNVVVPVKKWRTKTVNQKYKAEYGVKFPVVTQSKTDDEHAFCKVCECDISITHGGIDDIKRHTLTGNSYLLLSKN